MSLLLFGGSFDPPHLGHMQLLQNALQTVQVQKVIVMPVGLPPHKAATGAEAKWRVLMCSCFAELSPKVELSEREVHREGKSYTLDTVRALQKEAPLQEIYLSIGGDSLLEFRTWHDYQSLLNSVVLLVQGREESPQQLKEAAQSLQAEGAQILFCKGKTPAVSSTMVRKALRCGEPCAHYLPPRVWELIQKEGLYGVNKK